MRLRSSDLSSALEVLSVMDKPASQEFWSTWRHSETTELNHSPAIFCTYDQTESGTLQTAATLTESQMQAVRILSAQTEDHPRGVLENDTLVLLLETQRDTTSGRVVILSARAVTEFLEKSFGVSLHGAEQRVLLQVLAGYNLRYAAEVDNLSYETKRSQMKSVLAKTGIKRQGDLVGAALTNIFLAIGSSGENPSKGDNSCFFDYCNNYLPESVRSYIILDKSGGSHRVLDMGPKSGLPILVLHPQILPQLSDVDMAALQDLNLRLIWPMRNGALAPHDEDLAFEEHLGRTILGIEAAQTHFFDHPVTLLCLMSASYWGLEYARVFPHAVKNIVFAGACYKPVRKGNAAGRLRNGMIRMSQNNDLLMKLLLKFLNKKTENISALQNMLRDIYAPSAPDTSVINLEFEGPDKGRSIQYRFRQSIKSLKHDFALQGRPNWDLAKSISIPTAFIHGEEDSIHQVNDVQDLSDSLPDSQFHRLSACGQLIYYEHFSRSLAIVKRIALDAS